MNRNEIETLAVGMVIRRATQSTRNAPDFRLGKAERITKITYRGVSVKGRAYVGGETAWSGGATMTFSVSEGEDWIVLTDDAPAVEATPWHYGVAA